MLVHTHQGLLLIIPVPVLVSGLLQVLDADLFLAPVVVLPVSVAPSAVLAFGLVGLDRVVASELVLAFGFELL